MKHIQHHNFLWLLFASLLVLSGCNDDSTVESDELAYELVWADEFEGEGALNGDKWHHQTILPNNGQSWWNGELQHYTDRIENTYQEDGMMHLVAIKESFTDQGVDKQYTSARLNSKFAFTYGKVEVRAKLAQGAGTWPAIWTLGQNITEVGGYWVDDYGNTGWPACGEIDIMEHWGFNQDVIQSALHTPSSSGATINKGSVRGEDVSGTFHLYGMEWTSQQIDFYFDSTIFYTYKPEVKNADTWPFDQPQYLLLNIAMGGVGGEIDPEFTETEMVVDYVRVYQKIPQ